MKRTVLLLVLPGFLLLSGCDRPFEAVDPATIEVLQPDFSEVQTVSTLTIRLKVESYGDVAGIRVGDMDLSHTGAGFWIGQIHLEKGLNTLEIETYVGDEPVATDTIHAFLMPYQREMETDFLPTGVGGHTTTRLSDGSLLITGGNTFGPGSTSFSSYLSLPDGTVEAVSISPARVGHTATLLPDGRVLLLGGGFYGNVFDVFELTQVVSLFDPTDRRVTQISIQGEPIRRMYHSSVLRQDGSRIFIDLFGGRGDIAYGDASRLGIRQDIRTFELVDDVLHALDPAIGPLILPMAGHSETPVQGDTPGTTRHLVTGFSYDGAIEPATLMFERSSIGLTYEEGPLPPAPTIRHAAISLTEGVVALFGGRHPETDAIPDSASVVFVSEARRFFRFPASLIQNLIPRYGHSATRLPDGRILLYGGYGNDQVGISDAEFLTFDLN